MAQIHGRYRLLFVKGGADWRDSGDQNNNGSALGISGKQVGVALEAFVAGEDVEVT